MPAQRAMHLDAQRATRWHVTECGLGVVHVGDQSQATTVEDFTLQGRCHQSRGPVQQAHAQALLQRLDRVGHRVQIGVAGQHQADRIRVQHLHPAEELGAAHVAHALVGQDHLHVVDRQQVERIAHVAGGEDAVAVAAEQPNQRAQHVLLVIQQQQGAIGTGLGERLRAQVTAAQGHAGGIGRHRFAEQVALEHIAVVAAQETQLRL
ncbi:hypothetical protein G6F59_014037 [Rhizopus arrhizus]|nr:hypothetical protein G6F59_014037 [Rhizopus arrhizus]